MKKYKYIGVGFVLSVGFILWNIQIKHFDYRFLSGDFALWIQHTLLHLTDLRFSKCELLSKVFYLIFNILTIWKRETIGVYTKKILSKF